MASLKDIARKAGTSLGTVSHVLNNSRPVRPETRARVLQAIEELQYRPNLVARGLRAKRTRMIGVLISDIQNPFFAELAGAIQQRAHQDGYRIIICNTFEDSAIEAEHLSALQDYQVDGFIIAPTCEENTSLIGQVESSTPIVLVNRWLTGVRAPAVVADNYAASRQVTEHLVELGHQHVGLLLTLVGGSHNEDRIRGYREILAQHRIEFDPRLICYGGLTAESSRSAMRKFLVEQPDVTALFCGSTSGTLGALSAAREAGIHVPEQLAVIGSGKVIWANLLVPPLTHVVPPIYEMGTRATELLLDRMQARTQIEAHLQPDDTCIRLPVEFSHGGSCGCAVSHG